MRRRLVLCWRLAYMLSWWVLVHRWRRALMRRGLVLCWRLTYMLSRWVLVHRWRRALMRRGLVLCRRRLIYVLRRRTRSVVIVRRCVRCVSPMGGRPARICVSRRMRSGRVTRLGRISFCGRMRNVVVVCHVVGTAWVRCSSPIGSGAVGTFRRVRDIVIVDRSRRSRFACIVCPWRIHRRDVRHGRVSRLDHTCSMEGRWLGCCRHLGLAVIHRCQLSAVVSRQLFVLALHRRRSDVAFAQGRLLGSSWLSINSAVAAVIANPIHRYIVHYGLVVDIVYVGYVYAIDGLVVIKIATAPISTLVAVTRITESVVDASIEAYLRSPISHVPNEGRTAPSPITWRPEKTDLGSEYPRSRHPEIAIITVRPIARSPNVAGTRAPGLLVHRQRRRCNPYRDEDPRK
jgi:hypothetical protein